MKKIKIANIALFIAIVIGGICYYATHDLVVKTVASGLFVALAAVNFAHRPTKGFAPIMLSAFVMAMLGDIVLEIDFMFGAILFAIGHVLYFAAYCRLLRFTVRDFIPAAIIFIPAAAIILFLPIFDFGGAAMQIVCLIYALVIAFMLGKAIANCRRESNVLTKLLLIGSALFFFSDFMLLFSHFADVPRIMGLLCVYSYYPGQAVLAHAMANVSKEK